MTFTGIIITTLAMVLAAAVIAALVVCGVFIWYIADAERRSTREFTLIYRPLPPLEPRPLDTDPDGPAGHPFRPVYRGSPPSAPPPVTDSRPRKDR